MPFVEVFSTPGTPRPEQRRQIAERLVGEVMADEKREDIVRRVTRVLADADDDARRLVRAGRTWEEAKA